MTNDIGHVAVAGAGIGGLMSALALSSRGIDVTVFERDGAPPTGVAPADSMDWLRKGVPQSLAQAKEAAVPVIAYGQFVNEVISFLIVALAVFIIVKQANRFKRAEAAAPATPMKECAFCASSIPAKATRCPNCTSPLSEAAL